MPSNFSDLEKPEKYIFVKATTINESFFVLVKSYSISPGHLQCIMKEALFLYFLGSLLITFLITLSLGKEIQGYYYYCFGKMSGLKKWWILDPKICTNLNCSNTTYLKYDNQTSRSEKKEMTNSWKRSWLLNKFSSTMGKAWKACSDDDVRVWRVNPLYLSFYMLTTSASKVEVLICQVPAGHSPSLLTSKFKRLGWV